MTSDQTEVAGESPCMQEGETLHGSMASQTPHGIPPGRSGERFQRVVLGQRKNLQGVSIESLPGVSLGVVVAVISSMFIPADSRVK